MTKYLNDARELERKQIARDLHDGIAQSIYSLMLETRGVKWTPANEQPQKLQAIDRHFADVLQEVRDLATEMRPASLDDLGLAASLEQLCEQTSAMTGFKIMFSTKGTPRPLAEKQRTAVFRIVQEGIANAMKYAEVSEMEVALNFHEPLLEVKLRDYGKGFDQTAVHYGFGLLNMQERARSAKGSVMVHSEQEKGTEILVKLPYLEE